MSKVPVISSHSGAAWKFAAAAEFIARRTRSSISLSVKYYSLRR